MLCSKCGSTLDENQVCKNCGNHLKKKKRKKWLILSVVLIVTTAIIFLLNMISLKNENVEEANDIYLTQKLLLDYEAGIITVDEYVKYNLYAQYDKQLLNEKYLNYKVSNNAIHVDELVEKYYDSLSDETLSYYVSKINLDFVTFELDKENEENVEISVSDIIIDKVSAKSEKVTNLNKAVLSKNGNFLIWYTTTGSSATDYETAKSIADDLENTISQAENLTGYSFQYKSNIFSKGKTYKNQLKILKNEGIYTGRLETAMSVYLVEADLSSLAVYMGRSGALIKAWNKLRGGDQYGVVANPYIIIKPSSFSDNETLEQLYNHELFHHYQYEILCGSFECSIGEDPYIGEATANWFSALVSEKTNPYGYLNDWAGAYRLLTLLSKESEEKYTKGSISYGLYLYLANYSEFVNDGTKYIIESIYKENSLKYLNDKASNEELFNIQENIALKNLTQDYANKNLLVDPNYSDKELTINKTITENSEYNDMSLARIAIDYNLIDVNSDSAFEIEVTNNDNVAVFIIAQQDDKYILVDSSKKHFIFDTNDYGDYDKLYIAVVNYSLTEETKYSLNVKKIEKIDLNDESTYESISLLDCTASNDNLDKTISTYYYNLREKVVRYINTNIWLTDEDAQSNYESALKNTNYQNVRKNDKIVTYEYTEKSMEQYWNTLTKSSVIDSHNRYCGSDAVVRDFQPDIGDEEVYIENKDFVTTFNNYKIKVTMDTSASGIAINTVSSGVVDEVHQKEYLEVSTTTMGITFSNKIYTDFASGYSYSTQPYGGDVWYKEKTISQIVDLDLILDKLINMENVIKVTDNHYKIKMTNNDLKGLMSSAEVDASSLIGDIYVEVYTENGYIVKLIYDFTDSITIMDKFTTTIEFSDYNMAGDVKIPTSVSDSAKILS